MNKMWMWSIGAIIMFILVIIVSPKKLDWRETYSKDDVVPFGSKVIFESLQFLAPQQPVRVLNNTPYEELTDTTLQQTTMIIVTSHFAPDPLSWNALREYVKRGNTLFLSAETLDDSILISLRLSTTYVISDSSRIRLTNTGLSLKPVYISKSSIQQAINKSDTIGSAVLMRQETVGQYYSTTDSMSVYQSLELGKGEILLSTAPKLFTNYYALDSVVSPIIFSALSYIPQNQPILWDEYYKPFKSDSSSKLQYIIRDPNLRSGYYLALIGALVYVFFNSKRRQRIIPVMKPPTNATVEFIQTVGRLYYNNRDGASITNHSILSFIEYVRTRFYIRISGIHDEKFQELLQQKSGVSPEQVKELLTHMKRLESQPEISDDDVKKLFSQIQAFKQVSGDRKFTRPIATLTPKT